MPSVTSHQVIIGSGLSIPITQIQTSSGPGTVLLAITAIPQASCVPSVAPPQVVSITDNQNNSYLLLAGSNKLGAQLGINCTLFQVWGASDSLVGAFSGVQAFSGNINFNVPVNAVVSFMFVQPAVTFDTVGQDTGALGINSGAITGGFNPTITVRTATGAEIVIGAIGYVEQVTNLPVPAALTIGASNAGTIPLDSGVTAYSGTTPFASGFLAFGIVTYAFPATTAGLQTLSQTLNPATAAQIVWTELTIALSEGVGQSLSGPGSVLTGAATIQGSLTPSLNPGLNVLKLPLGQ